MSSAESKLNKLDVAQAQGLRIYNGAFTTSPVAAIQVEMGEFPLSIRRVKLANWVDLLGPFPVKAILQECLEHNETDFNSFGWIGNVKAESLGLCRMQYSPAVSYSIFPLGYV